MLTKSELADNAGSNAHDTEQPGSARPYSDSTSMAAGCSGCGCGTRHPLRRDLHAVCETYPGLLTSRRTGAKPSFSRTRLLASPR
jgi:hypothetical protein